jgi:hypothetical protein
MVRASAGRVCMCACVCACVCVCVYVCVLRLMRARAADTLPNMSVLFDESSNFVLYGSMFGVKGAHAREQA